jgi:formate/nitrite transporter FocA (FNT family)
MTITESPAGSHAPAGGLLNPTDSRPGAGGGGSSRPNASQIYAATVCTGEQELKRSSLGLAVSGLSAGLGMGLTGLGSAVILAAVGEHPWAHLLGSLLYPLGFIAVIVGRAQLYTENTLFPVLVVLDQRRHLLNTLRLWAVVFTANVVGALLFAALVVQTQAVPAPVIAALGRLGTHAVAGGFGHLFWAAVAGGWIIALMAWLVTASHASPIGQVTLVYLTTFVVGAAQLAHCIAGSGEALCALLLGQVSAVDYLQWLAAAALGNTVGGVVMVAMLNYGQVIGSGHDLDRDGRSLDEVEAEAEANSSLLRARRRVRAARG